MRLQVLTGSLVGSRVGSLVGSFVGSLVGSFVGLLDGPGLGSFVCISLVGKTKVCKCKGYEMKKV